MNVKKKKKKDQCNIEKKKKPISAFCWYACYVCLMCLVLNGRNVMLDGMLRLWQNPHWSTQVHLSQSKRSLRSDRFVSSSVQKPGTPVFTEDTLP